MVRVLVVDDSKAIRDRLVAMLSEIPGVGEVLEAHGSGEALELVRARAPRVVVLDVHMPGPSGLEVLPQVKASAFAPVVILITNHPTELHRRQAIGLGADHFFDKSTEFGRVCDVVRALLASGSG
jgi:CheY-like chemotaxis protein